MRLLSLKEVELKKNEEEARNKQKVQELSDEVNSLVKSFNITKAEILKREGGLLASHEEFCENISKETAELETKAVSLRAEVKRGLEPLKEREREVLEKESKVKKRDEETREKEAGVLYREIEVGRLEENFNLSVKEVERKERDLIHREKALKEREVQFNRHMEVNRKLIEQSRNKLRDWLEKERAKIREKQK